MLLAQIAVHFMAVLPTELWVVCLHLFSITDICLCMPVDQCHMQCQQHTLIFLLQELAAQLKGANLPVPAELDTEELYKTNLDKYLAEKGLPNKRADGTAKAAKQAAGTPLHLLPSRLLCL